MCVCVSGLDQWVNVFMVSERALWMFSVCTLAGRLRSSCNKNGQRQLWKVCCSPTTVTWQLYGVIICQWWFNNLFCYPPPTKWPTSHQLLLHRAQTHSIQVCCEWTVSGNSTGCVRLTESNNLSLKNQRVYSRGTEEEREFVMILIMLTTCIFNYP